MPVIGGTAAHDNTLLLESGMSGVTPGANETMNVGLAKIHGLGGYGDDGDDDPEAPYMFEFNVSPEGQVDFTQYIQDDLFDSDLSLA